MVFGFAVYSFCRHIRLRRKTVRCNAQNHRFLDINIAKQQPCCCYSSGFRDVIEVEDLGFDKTPALNKCVTFLMISAPAKHKLLSNFIVVTMRVDITFEMDLDG